MSERESRASYEGARLLDLNPFLLGVRGGNV